MKIHLKKMYIRFLKFFKYAKIIIKIWIITIIFEVFILLGRRNSISNT
jgi:hypothetical protein